MSDAVFSAELSAVRRLEHDGGGWVVAGGFGSSADPVGELLPAGEGFAVVVHRAGDPDNRELGVRVAVEGPQEGSRGTHRPAHSPRDDYHTPLHSTCGGYQGWCGSRHDDQLRDAMVQRQNDVGGLSTAVRQQWNRKDPPTRSTGRAFAHPKSLAPRQVSTYRHRRVASDYR